MKWYNYKASLVFIFLVAWSCQTAKVSTDQQQESNSEYTQDTSLVDLKKNERVKKLEAKIAEYRGTRTRDFDLLHTSLDLRFDYENEWVNGEAVLTVKPYFFPQKVLTLDAKDFEIHNISMLVEENQDDLNFRYDMKKVSVYLPKEFHSSDTLRVKIKYTAMPNENSGTGSAAITDRKGLYFINADKAENKPTQIWTQGETEHNSKWFPTFDTPNERATQDIKLTVEEKYRTISNGKLISQTTNEDGTRTDHWEMDLPHAPYLAAVVVGEFSEIEDSWEDIQVNYYVEEKFAEGAKIVFGNTPEMIGFFSDLLGVRYPWQKYDQVVVRDFVSGAMENTTISVFMEELNLDEREAIDSEWDGIIAHELFHQWFGNYVTNESWSNLTLNEAFANYSEYLWYDYKLGRDEADLHHVSEMEQYLSEAQRKQVDLIRFYYDDPEDMFDSHSYAKGGRILHMLRNHLGDKAFFGSLTHYLKKHAFQSVEVHDLRLAFEEVTGMDLNWYFNQWFLDSGHPVLEYEVDYSQPENLLITVAQRQDFENTPLYRLPFKVSWYAEGERLEKEFVLEKEWQQFALENPSPLDLLFIDEEKVLLAEMKSYRGFEHFLKQFEKSQKGVARYEALDSLTSDYSSAPEVLGIIEKALKDEFWAIREMALMKMAQNPEWIGNINGLEELLFEIAESDNKNTVRLGAIELLGQIDSEKYSPAFLRWMNDPSYYVAGTALQVYLENENNPNRSEIAGRFKDSGNIRILVALADYFIADPNTEQAPWFHRKLEGLSGQSLYYFIGYYGDYFSKLQGEDSIAAIDKLESLAGTHRASYVRIAAFMALFGFIDEEGVVDRAKAIFESEEDQMAKEYMEFFLSPYLE
ncbi:M1 family aminopeptidase [Arthrospiribacter ruber]|uniref:M1 family peptidase n=1 Tax=Arthrospiribacter ruber TaxID=2487934 RepID=A0A951IY09_9BACT|nr:M1 family aminopeptidase [Arthrospiribacter ruber]MBW3468868.1 M1 family peptidase [Arthrospiribacter ruber]